MTGAPSSPEPTPPSAPEKTLAARLMRTQTRETWLVPLLAVPMSRILTSRVPRDADLDAFTDDDRAQARQRAARVESIVGATMSGDGHALSDEEAWELVSFTHDYRAVSGLVLPYGTIMLAGMGAPHDLKGDPRVRWIGTWIASGEQPLPMTVLIAAHLLFVIEDDKGLLPRPHARFGPVTRAVARRMEEEGCTTWEHTLTLAHRYWAADGWLDLDLWEKAATNRLGESEVVEEFENREKLERDTEVRRHRAEQKRLQATLSEAKAELRALRPLRNKVDRLRVEAERLKVREAELVQARDRALARAEALEVANAELERARKDAVRRLAALEPDPVRRPEARSLPEVVYADELDLPGALLAGRDVFFFTGQVRKTSATSAADSLRVLGARDIRTFSVHKGSLGPETFPPKALVIIDVRFVGHSQSSVVAGRAERSGAQCLVVRSGKGSLARTVATALEGRKEKGKDGSP